jgi:hypothetical protein
MTGAERDYPTLARMAAGGSEEAGMFIEALRQSLIAAKAENRIAAMKRGRGITDPWCKP